MLAVLSALTSSVLVSEIWFIFTCESDAYIVEYVVSKWDMFQRLTWSPQKIYLHFSLYYFLSTQNGKSGDSKTNTLYYLTLPLKLSSPLRHIKFRWLYKWPSFHFLFFSITSSLIDFMFFTRQYPWRNSKTNGRNISNNLIRCKQ